MTTNYRRLVCNGGSLSATLPKQWVVANNMKKGDYVQIESVDGTLVLSKATSAKFAEFMRH